MLPTLLQLLLLLLLLLVVVMLQKQFVDAFFMFVFTTFVHDRLVVDVSSLAAASAGRHSWRLATVRPTSRGGTTASARTASASSLVFSLLLLYR